MKESMKLVWLLAGVGSGVYLLTVLKVRRIRSFSTGEWILYVLIAVFVALTACLQAKFHVFGT